MANPQSGTPRKRLVRQFSYHPELQETLFTWKLENFNLRMGQRGIPLDSPCFSIDPIDATRMFLRVIPLGGKNETLCVQLHRAIDNGPTLVTLRYKFQILDGCDTDGQPSSKTTGRGTRTFRLGTHRLRPNHTDYPRAYKWKRLLFDPRRELAINCHILPSAEASPNLLDEEDDPVNLTLSLALTLLYQEGYCSDIVLCAGEEKFKAHRSILCARSPTFAKELQKYSSDRKTIELKSDLNAPVLKALLKYLYSGRLADEIPDLDSEMYGVAVKYQVTDLKWKLYAFPKRSFAHTRVNSEVKVVNWTLRGFGDIETMVKVYSPLFSLEYPISCTFQLILYVTASTEIPVGNQVIPNVKISVRKTASEKPKLISLYLKLSVIDVGRRLEIFGNDYHVFANEDDWEFPPFLNTYKLLSDRLNYLPNNNLSLLCEFIVSDGTLSSYVQNTELQTFLQNPEDLRSFAMDIRDMYTSRKFSDVILRGVDGNVPAHKAILSARCPTLKSFLQKAEDLKVIHLAATTKAINKMLYYLYTGGDYPELENYEVAIELHLLCSDMKLLNVKEYCKEYMMSVLCAENAVRILEFAEGHGETRMSVWLEEFINTHREEIDEAARLELMLEYQRRRNIMKCVIL